MSFCSDLELDTGRSVVQRWSEWMANLDGRIGLHERFTKDKPRPGSHDGSRNWLRGERSRTLSIIGRKMASLGAPSVCATLLSTGLIRPHDHDGEGRAMSDSGWQGSGPADAQGGNPPGAAMSAPTGGGTTALRSTGTYPVTCALDSPLEMA